MREMLIRTPSEDLRNLHRDVWRMVHHTHDAQHGRSFQFAVVGAGLVLIRGPHLPAQHSRPAPRVATGERWRFQIDIRTIVRVQNKEQVIPQSDVPDWLAVRLPGFVVEALRASLPRRRAFKEGRTLPYRTIAGVVRVTDAERAAQVLRDGVGRSKGFGFGMLLLTECLDNNAGAAQAPVELTSALAED